MRRLLMLATLVMFVFFGGAPALQHSATATASAATALTALATAHSVQLVGVPIAPQILCPNGMPLPC